MLAQNNSDQEKTLGFIVHQYLDRVVPPSRYSEILFSQLMNMPYFGGMNHPSQFVIHEIAVLEGRANNSQTAAPSQFKRPLLKGFWKKHFFVPQYHIGINAMLTWGLNDPESKRFTNMALPVVKKHNDIGTLSHENYCKNLSAELATNFMEGMERRKKTGDYLVYYPHEGQNYYLCIGKHRQDEFIYKAIDLCSAQFPFLKDVLCNRTAHEVA